LSAIAQRAMARQPEERYASAGEMVQALRQWGHDHAAHLAREQRTRRAPRHKSRTGLHMAVAAAVAAVVLGLWWQSTSSTPSAANAAQAKPADAVTTAPGAPMAVAGIQADTVAPSPSQDAPAAAADALPQVVDTAPVQAAPKAPTLSVAAAKPRKPVAKPVVAAAPKTDAPAVVAKGSVQMAISPWGQVEVNGKPVGTTPPLTRLELSSGNHTITVRNEDFPPYTRQVRVDPDQPVLLKHRFGS